MRVKPYAPADRERWEAFVADAPGATLHHTRRFLEYHGERFEDCSVLCEDGNDTLVAVLPAARDPKNPTKVVCHPGATVGSLVFRKAHSLRIADEVLKSVLAWYVEQGMSTFLYKTTPQHFMSQPVALDQYLLWRFGAKLAGMDIWTVIDLNVRSQLMKDKREALRRAARAGLTIDRETGNAVYADFHAILAGNLDRRYDSRPAHTAAELIDLAKRLADRQHLWIVRNQRQEMVGGLWVLRHQEDIWHAQYIATNPEGRADMAADLLFSTAADAAKATGARYFSFGASSVGMGGDLKKPLFDFKQGFGGGTVCHLFFELDLRNWSPPAGLL